MQAGAVLGAYRVLKQIGAGGMGSVWVAEHTILGRRAALKVLHPDMSEREDIVKRFFNEARAATSINDPGIVQIFDFGYHDDGSAYIVMELLEGEVLEHRIQRGRLDVAEALRLMRQVASTLGAAHARGIIHRDLKPDNIFITKDPEVAGGERARILDFGIAKLADERKTAAIDLNQGSVDSTGVIGTPLYMSPEQRAGKNVDARSDVYALGCVLYQMLTGVPPYDAEELAPLIAMHLSAPIPLPSAAVPGIPRVVDEIIRCCMAKSSTERFASGTELAAALAEAAMRPSASRALDTTLNAALSIDDQMTAVNLPQQPLATTDPLTIADTLRRHDSQPRLGSQPRVASEPAAPNPNKVTTLTGGIATVNRSASRTRPGVLIAAGLLTAGGAALVVWGVARTSSGDATENAAAPTESADTTAEVEAQPTPPTPDPAATPPVPEPTGELDARLATAMGEVVTKFRAWARDHANAPCPQVADLGAPTDPWGSVFTLTCSDQPDDQQIGIVSAGPDRVPKTEDDVRSWRVASVRELAQGARWEVEVADAAETADPVDPKADGKTDENVATEQVADANAKTTAGKGTTKQKRVTKGTTQKQTTQKQTTQKTTTQKQTTTPTTTTQPTTNPQIKLDENGIPIHR